MKNVCRSLRERIGKFIEQSPESLHYKNYINLINKKSSKSDGEEVFYDQLIKAGIEQPHREHAFHNSRKWRIDFAWPIHFLGVEIEGGIWSGGRHTRGYGYEADLEKYNTALSLGWRIFRFSTDQVKKGIAISMILDEFKKFKNNLT